MLVVCLDCYDSQICHKNEKLNTSLKGYVTNLSSLFTVTFE